MAAVLGHKYMCKLYCPLDIFTFSFVSASAFTCTLGSLLSFPSIACIVNKGLASFYILVIVVTE